MEFINYTTYNRAEDIKRLKFITENVPTNKEPPLKVIEIGCGNGNICYQLAKYGNDVTGIDISQTTIDTANKNFGDTPGLKFEVRDAEKMKLEDLDKYDVIVCSEVLEHLYEPGKFVQNFKNILKEDGVAIVTVPNGYGPREFFVTRPVQKIMNGKGFFPKLIRGIKGLFGYKGANRQTSAEDLDHIQFFTMKSLKRIANIAGMKIVKKKAGNFIENTFPFSIITRRAVSLQRFDCMVADILPLFCTSAFYTVWELDINKQ